MEACVHDSTRGLESRVPALEPPPALDLARHALFLDLDGTLVELAGTPEAVLPDDGLAALLRALSPRLNGAIAVISGRAIRDADRILKGAVTCVAGLHGQECRLGELMLREAAADASVRAAAADAQRLVDAGALSARIEDKGSAIALHFRTTPEQEPAVRLIAEELARAHGLRALQGHMVAELVPLGPSKGEAVSQLMQMAPFAGRVPVAVGDDVTDEDAFAVVRTMGGVAILVGQPRQTGAMFRLPDVAAVRAWLAASLREARL
jgi:trehalose 6-phosphate phosphatase